MTQWDTCTQSRRSNCASESPHAVSKTVLSRVKPLRYVARFCGFAGPRRMSVSSEIVDVYRTIVRQLHPTRAGGWPIVSGHDALVGGFRGWLVLCLRHTGWQGIHEESDVGDLSPDILQVDDLNPANLSGARRVLEKHL